MNIINFIVLLEKYNLVFCFLIRGRWNWASFSNIYFFIDIKLSSYKYIKNMVNQDIVNDSKYYNIHWSFRIMLKSLTTQISLVNRDCTGFDFYNKEQKITVIFLSKNNFLFFEERYQLFLPFYFFEQMITVIFCFHGMILF